MTRSHDSPYKKLSLIIIIWIYARKILQSFSCVDASFVSEWAPLGLSAAKPAFCCGKLLYMLGCQLWMHAQGSLPVAATHSFLKTPWIACFTAQTVCGLLTHCSWPVGAASDNVAECTRSILHLEHIDPILASLLSHICYFNYPIVTYSMVWFPISYPVWLPYLSFPFLLYPKPLYSHLSYLILCPIMYPILSYPIYHIQSFILNLSYHSHFLSYPVFNAVQ